MKKEPIIAKIDDDAYYTKQALMSDELFGFGRDAADKVLSRCNKFTSSKYIWVKGSDLRKSIDSFINEY